MARVTFEQCRGTADRGSVTWFFHLEIGHSLFDNLRFTRLRSGKMKGRDKWPEWSLWNLLHPRGDCVSVVHVFTATR